MSKSQSGKHLLLPRTSEGHSGSLLNILTRWSRARNADSMKRASGIGLQHVPSRRMHNRHAESVYRIVDVVGESSTSWEDAGRRAVETAAASIRDLRVAEVVKMDMKVENGKVTAFRTRVALSFKYEA